jgi:hypothetical protein
MPLFNFTANDYGENWFVAAGTREEAISAVKRAIHANWQREMAYAAEEAARYGKPSERVERGTLCRDGDLRFLNACINNKPTYEGGFLIFPWLKTTLLSLPSIKPNTGF